MIVVALNELHHAKGHDHGGDDEANPNSLFKAEVIHRRGPWRSVEAVEFDTLEWINWFNNRRLLEPIGNLPPAEAEARYYSRTKVKALAA